MGQAATSVLNQSPAPVINICGHKTVEYMIQALCALNQRKSAGEVRLRALGPSITRGVGLAQILTNDLPFKITSTKTGTCNLQLVEQSLRANQPHESSVKTPYIEIALNFEGPQLAPHKTDFRPRPNRGVPYPAYCLLLDMLLHKEGTLTIDNVEAKGCPPILAIRKTNAGYSCKPMDANQQYDNKKKLWSRLRDVYYRSGLIISPDWNRVARMFGACDDIVVGLDTNILTKATITEQVLSSISIVNPYQYVYTPNWILLVVPSAVIHELEQGANLREPGTGLLKESGRLSFRALQEIMELTRNAEFTGVSLMIVGETDPVLDTRAELRGLRHDLYYSRENKQNGGNTHTASGETDELEEFHGAGLPKSSSGDMIIRTQYKHFLRQIDFHKGIFFLTSDKSNSALASAEGLHSIYYRLPDPNIGQRERIEERIPSDLDSPVILHTPLGKLIYELVVQFGVIRIGWGNNQNVIVRCDQKGEAMDNWLFREIQLEKSDLNRLTQIYEQHGRIELNQANQACLRLMHALFGTEGGGGFTYSNPEPPRNNEKQRAAAGAS